MALQTPIVPHIEQLDDGSRLYRWDVKCQWHRNSSLPELSDRVAEATLKRYYTALSADAAVAMYANAKLDLRVKIEQKMEDLFAVEVRSSGNAPNWDMASMVGVMQSLDELIGPVLEIQGRVRSSCPPWWLSEEKSSG